LSDVEWLALFLNRLEDWIDEDYVVRVVNLFVDQPDLLDLGLARAAHAGRHFAVGGQSAVWGETEGRLRKSEQPG
jgi:hypothetical protein